MTSIILWDKIVIRTDLIENLFVSETHQTILCAIKHPIQKLPSKAVIQAIQMGKPRERDMK